MCNQGTCEKGLGEHPWTMDQLEPWDWGQYGSSTTHWSIPSNCHPHWRILGINSKKSQAFYGTSSMNADWSMMRSLRSPVWILVHTYHHIWHMYTNVHESRHPFWLEVVFSKTKTIKNSLLPKAPAPSLLPIEMPMTLPAWIFCTAARAVTSPSLITFKGTSPASSSHVWSLKAWKKTRNCEQNNRNNRLAVGSVGENMWKRGPWPSGWKCPQPLPCKHLEAHWGRYRTKWPRWGRRQFL